MAATKKAKKKTQPKIPVAAPAPEAPLMLDIGCGRNKQQGFHGVDQYAFEGVDTILNVVERDAAGRFRPWPWADGSVQAIFTSHFIEHLEARERIHFVNEAYRVLRPGGQLQIIAPHWSTCRAYGDLTHKWPPVSEFWLYYLDKPWRMAQTPHNDIEFDPDGYACDFHWTWQPNLNPEKTVGRSQEYLMGAIGMYIEHIWDLNAILTKR